MAGTFNMLVAPLVMNGTPEQQLGQMRDYLFQLVEKLNVEFDTLQTKTERAVEIVRGTSGSAEADAVQKAKDAVERFNETKALIIKSADIVNAYYEYSKEKFTHEYTAESDFGTYIENITQTIVKDSRSIQQNIDSISAIQGELEQQRTINGYIRTGLIDIGDGIEEIGIELYADFEQTQAEEIEYISRRFATFTTSGIDFYDGDRNKVSYISDGVLHVYRAEILGSLGLGAHYEIDVTDGIAFMWRG